MPRLVHVLAAAIVAAPVAFGAAAQQSTTPPAGSKAMAPPSTAMAPAAAASATTFVPTAASANLFEIESSQLALEHGQSAKVKDFAKQMVSDHKQAATKMKQALAEAKIAAPPEKLNAKDQKVYDKLKAAKGSAFDKAYIEAQYNAHVEAVNLFATYAKNGDNPRIKALASELLPTLQMHLDEVTKLRS
jgi:putative membrane protein